MQNNSDRKDIRALIDRYENMLLSGKKVYFDTDEFEILADYYMSVDDNTYAEEIIDEGLIMHPNSPTLTILKAKNLLALGDYEEALSNIEAFSEEGDLDISLIKVEAMLNMGLSKEAEEIINSTISSNLSTEDLYTFMTELGFIMNDISKYDKAAYYLEQSLKIENQNTEVITDLAFAYEMMEDYDKAIYYNNTILDQDPYSYEGWVNLGKLYSLKEEFGKAIDAFDFASTINEDDVGALKMKALSLFLNDNTEEAIKIFEECISINPNDITVYDSIIEGYELLGQYEDMIKFLDLKEERFGPEGIAIKRAFVEVLKNNLLKAWEIYNEIPEDERDSVDFYMLEAELNFLYGNIRESEASYIKAALFYDDDVDIIDRLANVSVAQEKYEQAAEYLEKLLDLDPEYPTAKTRLAIIRFEIGTKEPFDELMDQFSDDELREMMQFISGDDNKDYSQYTREQMLMRLNEARENRILFKNIKY